jgi:hypothetical protein
MCRKVKKCRATRRIRSRGPGCSHRRNCCAGSLAHGKNAGVDRESCLGSSVLIAGCGVVPRCAQECCFGLYRQRLRVQQSHELSAEPAESPGAAVLQSATAANRNQVESGPQMRWLAPKPLTEMVSIAAEVCGFVMQHARRVPWQRRGCSEVASALPGSAATGGDSTRTWKHLRPGIRRRYCARRMSGASSPSGSCCKT